MVFTKELSGLRNLAERMVKLLEYELFGAINALRSKGVKEEQLSEYFRNTAILPYSCGLW